VPTEQDAVFASSHKRHPCRTSIQLFNYMKSASIQGHNTQDLISNAANKAEPHIFQCQRLRQ